MALVLLPPHPVLNGIKTPSHKYVGEVIGINKGPGSKTPVLLPVVIGSNVVLIVFVLLNVGIVFCHSHTHLGENQTNFMPTTL